MDNKKAIQLKEEAEKYLWKYGGTDDDKRVATDLFMQAISKSSDGTLDNVKLFDCYARLGLSYIDRVEKDDENDFMKTLEAYETAVNLNVPSWMNKSIIISLLINPVRHGFHIKHKDVERAKKLGALTMDSGCLYQVACYWMSKDDVTEEEVDFALNYFNIIVERRVDYGGCTIAMALCRIAMIYAYNRDKTAYNFNKACDYFKQSMTTPGFLESGSNQIPIPFCQYSMFISRVGDYGFLKEYENREEAEICKRRHEELCDKNPRELYFKAGEQYQFHKFAIPEYFDIAERYYNIAMNSNNIKPEAKIILVHYIANIYTNNKEKHIENYYKAIDYHMEAINLGLSMDGNKSSIHNVIIGTMQDLLWLLNDSKHFNFDFLYSKSKRVEETRKKILEMTDKFIQCDFAILNRVIEVFDKINTVQLKKEDKILKDRQKKVLHSSSTSEISNKDLDNLIETKRKLALIENNNILYEYYDGFMRTFVQVYAVSIIIKSGQLSLSTDNIGVTISTKLISLLPLIGEPLSSTSKMIWDYMKSIEMINKAVNVVKFSTTSEQFNELVQEAIIDIIDKRKDDLIALHDISDERSQKWYEKVKTFCDNMKVKIDESVWVQELETPMQKLGSEDATKLILEVLSNGKIYQGELAIKIHPDIKKERLIEYAILISIEEKNKKEEEKAKNTEVVDITSCSYLENMFKTMKFY